MIITNCWLREKHLIIFFMIIEWFLIWTNLNPLHWRMHCGRFGRNRFCGSWEEDFFNFVNVFLPFRNYLPLEKNGTIHLNKFESSSPKDALCQVWLKLVQLFLRRRFLNFVNVCLLLRIQGCFVTSLVEIDPVVLEKKMKMWEVYAD